MKRGKKYKESSNLIDKNSLYETEKALDLCTKASFAKFDETVELHVRLGVDSRHADQQVRGAVILPNGTGKTVKILAICKGLDLDAAKEAGADYYGSEDMVEKIQKENWLEFDVLIATPNVMPNPKAGTVTTDIARAIREAKAGKIEYRLDKTNIIHCPIGKISFGVEKLKENFETLLGAIINAKPNSIKGTYIKSCVIASTMGPGIKVRCASV